jgi:hypothetical protein
MRASFFYRKNLIMKRAKYFFIVAAVALLIVFAGFIEQYYRLEVCNFVSRDGESHG